MEELRYLIRGDQFKIEFIEVFKKSKGSGTDYMSQLLLLGKVEYGGGQIFNVVLEC